MSDLSLSWGREEGKLLQEERKIRLALSLLLLLFLVAGRDAITDRQSVLLATLLMVAGLAVARFAARPARSPGAQRLQIGAVATALLDLVAVTLLLRGTGGLHSGFFSLYLVSLVFAAAFFRGLELALLTVLAVLFYVGVSWGYVDSTASAWHMFGGLLSLILVAWFAYSLSGVLRREKENNDQLLRHLTEGVMLFDRDQRLTLVNSTLLQMIGEAADASIVGRKRPDLAAGDKVLAWMLGDIGMDEAGFRTRVGCFPDADLPLVECTTIPCASDSSTGGWVVVCKDLRDLRSESKSTRPSCDKLAPLSNLRALSEALYGMAEYLDDKRRWQVVEVIERHTLALQSVLAEMLHRSEGDTDAALELDFVDVSSLLSSTRRLLEIQPVGDGVDVEIFCQQGLPEINADRARLGQCLLQLSKALVALGKPDEKLVIDVRNIDRDIVFSLELVKKVGTGAEPLALTDEELAQFGELCDLPTFQIIEEHHGTWECRPDSSHYRRVVFALPISGPAHVEEETASSDGRTVNIPASPGRKLPLEPRLAAEITNQLKNTLNVIRGYAEMALQESAPEAQRRALNYAIDLSDEASDLVETLQPSTGEFDLEVKLSPEAIEAELPEAAVLSTEEGAILVVDDDAAMRGLLVDVLKSAGYRTMEANDGKQAVERIRLSRPLLAFVDLSMPRVTGVEVMREARRYAPGLPVILMTGYATQVAVEALGEEKPYAILSKPFTIAEVLSLAKAVIGVPSASDG